MAPRKQTCSDVKTAVENMSDEQLRRDLVALGFTPGPITDNTRGILQKKLQKLQAESAKSTTNAQKSERSRRSGVTPKGRRRQQQQVLQDGEGEDEGEVLASRPSTAYAGNRRAGGVEESRRASARFHTEDTEEWSSERSSPSVETLPRASVVRGGYLAEQHRSPLLEERDSGSAAEYNDFSGAKYRSSIRGGTRDRGEYLEKYRSTLGGEHFSGGTTEQSSYLGDKYRSSLGGERYLGGTTEQSSYLGDKYRPSLGRERNDNLGDRFKSSLGGETFSVGTREPSDYLGETYRSILRREGITGNTSGLGNLGQDILPSAGGDRFSGGLSGHSSLGEKYRSGLGREELSGNTVAYVGSLGETRRPVFGGERGLGGTTDYGHSELRSRVAGERSNWAGLATSRDGERSLNSYDELGKSRSQLSYKRYPGLDYSKSAQSRSAWSRSLEYYLSRLLRGLSVLLVVIFLGILVVKSGIVSSKQQNDIKLLPSDCNHKDDQYCKAKQKQITLHILSELYDFLSLEAGSFECGNPSGLRSKCIPINRAKEHVTSISGHSPDKFENALDWLLNRDKHLGIWAKGEDDQIVTSRSDLFCVESSHPRLGVFCRLRNALYTAISNLFLAIFVLLVMWLFLIYLKYKWKTLEDEEKQMFEMVEKIIDVVKHHYKDYAFGVEQNPYIGILHVRDTLIMPQDRRRLKSVWDRAVQFIENNESRLRTESQRVAGADLRVWRWIQTRNDRLGEGISSTSPFSPLSK